MRSSKTLRHQNFTNTMSAPTPPPRYRAQWRINHQKQIHAGPPRHTESEAMTDIQPDAKVAAILKDLQGKDHPDNAGKFFLYRIVI
jgi:hypothetical protein